MSHYPFWKPAEILFAPELLLGRFRAFDSNGCQRRFLWKLSFQTWNRKLDWDNMAGMPFVSVYRELSLWSGVFSVLVPVCCRVLRHIVCIWLIYQGTLYPAVSLKLSRITWEWFRPEIRNQPTTETVYRPFIRRDFPLVGITYKVRCRGNIPLTLVHWSNSLFG